MLQSTLPPALRAAIETVLNAPLTHVQDVVGGCINHTLRVETAQGVAFLKWHPDAPEAMLTREAEGLQLLAATQTIRIPKVLCVQEKTPELPSFLLLEWIENMPPRDSKYFAQRLGEELAALHLQSASGTFGLECDNYIGELPQINTPHKRWSEFYRVCRLMPQIEWARQRGYLTAQREQLLNTVCEQIEVLLDGLESRPSLLHGDLWSGNYLAAGEEPVLIDPAVYYGEREMEIAYCQLFGGFDAEFYQAYHATFPLQAGYEKRRPLHQLYHLLNHLNHFGESYGPRVEAACRAALSAG
jgi:fructosamine-3-kinase